MKLKSWALSAAFCAATGVLSGCGTATGPTEASDGPAAQSAARAEGCQTVSVSRVKSYKSISGLATDSQLVVTARVLPGTKQVVAGTVPNAAGLSADLVPLEIGKTLRGSAPKELTLRVTTSSCEGSNLPSPLEEGATYVLFLKPFELSPGKPTGEWVMTSDASFYKATGAGFTLLEKEPVDTLPAQLADVAELTRELGLPAID